MELSKMFGVERMVPFKVKKYTGAEFRITVYDEVVEHIQCKVCKDGWEPCQSWTICDIIASAPGNIIRLPPPLTDEQREQLRAIYTLGGRWLAIDANGLIYAYIKKPLKPNGANFWQASGTPVYYDNFPVNPDLSIYKLAAWYSAEPYDIAQALGVSVELLVTGEEV